jgi:hypothetical protein
MKRFKIEQKGDLRILYVTLHQPPYQNENILNMTGWKEEDVIITEIKQYGEE